eukprot:symbB.v1.2.006520.t1/scaffold380.1/size216529/10
MLTRLAWTQRSALRHRMDPSEIQRVMSCQFRGSSLRWMSGSASDGGASSSAETGEDESGSGLFSDAWWPEVAQRCHQRLAQRPQTLPEDPMAQGVVSWVRNLGP